MSKPASVSIGTHALDTATEPFEDREAVVWVEGREEPFKVVLLADGALPVLSVDGRVLVLVPLGEDRWYEARTRRMIRVERANQRRPGRADAPAGAAELRAPMPGRIVRVLVSAGDAVVSGAGAVVIEAMKMENELSIPRAGVVRRVAVRNGDTVERDALLLELEETS